MIRVPLLNPKFALRTRREVCANFGFAALVSWRRVCFMSVVGSAWIEARSGRAPAGMACVIPRVVHRGLVLGLVLLAAVAEFQA